MRIAKLLPIVLLAAAATAAVAASGSSLVDDLAGVYKDRFRNGDVEGDKYQSEDVLEVVKVAPDQAYIRAHLEFYNGHSCAIYGIARLRGDTLVYRPKDDPASGCVLTLKKSGGRVVFGDAGSACKDTYCGARGAFDGAGFDYAKKRPIRYMKLLLASREYAEAVAERDGKK